MVRGPCYSLRALDLLNARAKLLGRDPRRLTYDDLIPVALRRLRSRRLLHLVRLRRPLVICDESQDTSDDQWELLNVLRADGRLLFARRSEPDDLHVFSAIGADASRGSRAAPEPPRPPGRYGLDWGRPRWAFSKYSRNWWAGTGLNRRHQDFQSWIPRRGSAQKSLPCNQTLMRSSYAGVL